jgi:diaminopimelate decarboxylase
VTSGSIVSYRRNHLFIEDIPAARLIKDFKTPLYVYSRTSILSQYRKFALAFSQRPALICYALKANSNVTLCQLLRKEGAGADVVSGGELSQAIRAGFSPKNILFSGVGKNRDEMKLGIQCEILAFNVESFEELRALEAMARSLRRKAFVSVRVNFSVKVATHPHTATSGPHSKFGVDENVALKMYSWAQKSPWIKIRGIHCHIGSQILSHKPYAMAARLMRDFIRKLELRNIFLSFADIGGGFGIAGQNGKSLDISKVVDLFVQALKDWPSLKLVIEPGRFLMAESGILLTTILYSKRNKNHRFLIVDAGMNDFLRPALYGARHPIVSLITKRGPAEPFDIAGPVCESADFFARNLRLPFPAHGEALAILNTGAYGFSMSSQYNFRPRPAEILIDGKTVRLIRRRETFKDLIQTEVF